MAYVIGFDFGNMNSFPCFISDIDLNQGKWVEMYMIYYRQINLVESQAYFFIPIRCG